MAKRKPATMNDDMESFFEPAQAPALVRMERERGAPRTPQVHPAEVERWRAKGWKPVMLSEAKHLPPQTGDSSASPRNDRKVEP